MKGGKEQRDQWVRSLAAEVNKTLAVDARLVCRKAPTSRSAGHSLSCMAQRNARLVKDCAADSQALDSSTAGWMRTLDRDLWHAAPKTTSKTDSIATWLEWGVFAAVQLLSGSASLSCRLKRPL